MPYPAICRGAGCPGVLPRGEIRRSRRVALNPDAYTIPLRVATGNIVEQLPRWIRAAPVDPRAARSSPPVQEFRIARGRSCLGFLLSALCLLGDRYCQ